MIHPTARAKEMIDEFSVVGLQQRDEGLQCAIICQKKIIETLKSMGINSVFQNTVLEELQKES